MSQPCRHPRVSSSLSRCLFGLLIGFLFLGNPPSVAGRPSHKTAVKPPPPPKNLNKNNSLYLYR